MAVTWNGHTAPPSSCPAQAGPGLRQPVTWNGSYCTTIILDATHVTVAIPASDLAATGSASLIATNPGAAASSALTVSIN